ncbi:MAG: hypothetical protein DWQ04_01515, partial [Chloroflexi bacterium]
MNKINLRQLLEKHFNKSELRDICFELDIDFENLPGQTKRDKVRELITFCHRHGSSPKLQTNLRKLRPAVDWPDIADEPPYTPPATASNIEKRGGGINISGGKVTIKGD